MQLFSNGAYASRPLTQWRRGIQALPACNCATIEYLKESFAGWYIFQIPIA